MAHSNTRAVYYLGADCGEDGMSNRKIKWLLITSLCTVALIVQFVIMETHYHRATVYQAGRKVYREFDRLLSNVKDW